MKNYRISLSVIVVHLGSDNLIINFLKSLYQSNLPFIFETIIIDNKSNSTDLSSIVNEYKNCKIIQLDNRMGYSAASNKGILEAKGEFILWCNNDLIFEYNSIIELYTFLIKNSNYGIASPCLLNEDKSLQPCYSLYNLNLFSIIFQLTGFKNKNSIKSFDISVAPGACCMIRKNSLEQIGNVLDNSYFMYCEEFDLSFKFIKNNFKIRYIGSSNVIHLGGKTTKKTSINFLIQSLKSKFKYLYNNKNNVEAILFYFYLLFKFFLKSIFFLSISFFSLKFKEAYFLNKKLFLVLLRKDFFQADNLIIYYND